ncbi:hypothetical protein EDB19DRAFT_1835708 [Suillus lakei]|nr:hypothetical protein EDB19DRAFT_1835708 [Suillus lakei]
MSTPSGLSDFKLVTYPGNSKSLVSSDGDKKRAKKLTLSDLSLEERPAIKWAWKRMLMDLLTLVVWPHNETEDRKNAYFNEILAQVNTLFKTNIVLTKDLIGLMTQSVTQFCTNLLDVVDQCAVEFKIAPTIAMSQEKLMEHMVERRQVLLDLLEENCVIDEASNCEILLLFGSKILHRILLNDLYTSTYMPLRDESFLKELNTTTSHMFSHIAVGYGIDKVVEEASGRNVRFLGERYAPQQLAYFNAVELALNTLLHKEALLAQFLELHMKGLYILRGKSGLLPPEKLIYMPKTMQELIRPCQPEAGTTTSNGSEPHLQSLSASAMLQVPAQEVYTVQYMTGPDCYDSEFYGPVNQDVVDMSQPWLSSGYST